MEISAIDTMWVLFGTMFIFFMHSGFALLETGFSRVKNSSTAWIDNLLDFAIASLVFWAFGYGIMFGNSNPFIGEFNFVAMHSYPDINPTIPSYANVMFHGAICATTAAVVSGAMLERVNFKSFLIYSTIISGFVYPVAGHWAWGGGWLADLGFHDFAGSTVVHSVGGWIALVGAAILGPRIGKYGKDGRSKAIPGHNLTVAALGVFILWFGWFGFNPGSQLAASTEADAIAISHVFLTTNLAACAGGFFALVVSWMKYGKPSLSLTLNGVLAGLVGITAGCDAVSPTGAVVIGAICGVVMILAVDFIDKVLKIDDPVGASSVHGVCGFLGTILTGLFSTSEGLFYGHGAGFLGAQIFGALVVGAWAASMGFTIFKVLDKVHGLRVPARVEEEGLDIYEHGESAYN